MLAPVRAQRNLTEEVVARLAGEISSGRIAAGQQLPTEQEMVASLGVSRTVVREAVAALKARGLVVTRQGSGAFVADEALRRSFMLDPETLRSLDAVLDVLELRLAVETEAAGLACKRANVSAIKAIRAAHAAFESAIGRGDSAADEDFAFHLAIATATGNAQFPEFLRFLGTFVIPRQSVRIWGTTFVPKDAFLSRIVAEHRRILDAVEARDADAARSAMREHLTRAAERYRKIASGSGGDTAA